MCSKILKWFQRRPGDLEKSSFHDNEAIIFPSLSTTGSRRTFLSFIIASAPIPSLFRSVWTGELMTRTLEMQELGLVDAAARPSR